MDPRIRDHTKPKNKNKMSKAIRQTVEAGSAALVVIGIPMAAFIAVCFIFSK
jgi:hypothetical protein